MDALGARLSQQTAVRRCHVWRWSADPPPVECERQTLVVGGLSKVGLLCGGATAVASANGKRRRRDAAAAETAPGWRYVTTGAGQAVDGLLYVSDASGAALSFDLRSSGYADSPRPGWLRFRMSGSATWWSVEIK